MKFEPAVFEDPDPKADLAAIAQGRADAANGRAYPHSIVKQWLQTWGEPGRLPFKEWLARRDG